MQKRIASGCCKLLIILLAVATGLMHIWLAIPENLTMFYLNGIGYLVLAGALYLPALRSYREPDPFCAHGLHRSLLFWAGCSLGCENR
jgi:hypothetical protein